MDTHAMIEALHATGPHPDLVEQLTLFGQFVGSWDVEITNFAADGQVTRVPGEWHFGWALEGRAVMDVWIAPRRELRSASGEGEYGATLRFFDPGINAWRSTWIGPARGAVKPFVAQKVNNQIVLEGHFGDTLEQWIFSDITTAQFHWRYMRSTDSGVTWNTVQEMAAKRVGR